MSCHDMSWHVMTCHGMASMYACMYLCERWPHGPMQGVRGAQPPRWCSFFSLNRMNIRLHRWTDALELALKHQTHVDTVLAYRQQHTYTHKYIHTDLPTYIHTCIHTCIHVYMHTCMHLYMHTCMHAFVYV